MNPTILNREFQHPNDGWYQIEPKGEHPNRAAKIVQVIDDTAVATIVNRFNADAAAGTLRHGNEMLIDHEHFSGDTDKESRAYGWLTKLENRADGIYGQIRWTTTGKAAVDGGDYRFFSTEYDPADMKIVNADQPRKVRPVRLDGLSLTNMNNNRGQRPITNRNEQSRPDAVVEAANQNTNRMKNIATKLGLAAEASEDAILAEVTKIMNRATEAEGKVTPLTQRVTALESDNQTLLGEQIDADFATAKITDEKIINRHKPLLSDPKHFKNRAERVAFIADLTKPEGKTTHGKVINRGDGKQPGTETAPGNEQELAQKAEAEVQEYKIKNRCSYGEARNAVRNAKPELFGLTK